MFIREFIATTLFKWFNTLYITTIWNNSSRDNSSGGSNGIIFLNIGTVIVVEVVVVVVFDIGAAVIILAAILVVYGIGTVILVIMVVMFIVLI